MRILHLVKNVKAEIPSLHAVSYDHIGSCFLNARLRSTARVLTASYAETEGQFFKREYNYLQYTVKVR